MEEIRVPQPLVTEVDEVIRGPVSRARSLAEVSGPPPAQRPIGRKCCKCGKPLSRYNLKDTCFCHFERR